jgi:predicted porin
LGAAGATCPYEFGPAIVGVNYSNVQYRSGADSLFKGHATFNIAGVFGQWTIRPAVQLFAGYSYTRGGEVDGVDERAQYHNVTLGAQYALSKHSTAYLMGGNPVAATASVSDKGNGHSSATQSQAIVSIGVRHKF